jgi:hypothetical protein
VCWGFKFSFVGLSKTEKVPKCWFAALLEYFGNTLTGVEFDHIKGTPSLASHQNVARVAGANFLHGRSHRS